MVNLSFIIPCYNTEDFISDCLDSIYNQGISNYFFEVICVDDVSTDNTCRVIQEYQTKQANLSLIRSEQKCYPGGARNLGLNAAEGKYIWFIDSDDYINDGSITRALSLLENEEEDILLFNYAIENNKHQKEAHHVFDDTETVSGQRFLSECFHDDFNQLTIVWQRIFRRLFLVENQLSFPDLLMGEDCILAWESLIKAKRVKSISDCLYTYRQNNLSISRVSNSAVKEFSRSLQFAIEVRALEGRLLAENLLQAVYRNKFENTIRYSLQLIPGSIFSLAGNQRTIFYMLFRKHAGSFRGLVKSASFSPKKRLLLYFLFYSSFIGQRFFEIAARFVRPQFNC